MRRTAFLLVLLALCVALTAQAGALWGGAAAAALALLGALFERWRAARFLRRLRGDGSAVSGSDQGGLWGEVAQRVSRLLRERDEQIRVAQGRLQEFLVALENSPNGVVLLDERARIEWCNQTAAQHFGLDAHRDRMQIIGNLVRDPDLAAYMASWNYSREVVLSMPQPGTLALRLAVQAHPYAGNRRLLLSRDVTAVEQAEAMRRDFVANVSHEVRTPLTVLAGFVEAMQTLPMDAAERSHYLGLMGQQAQRMQSLVEDLLTLSRLEGTPAPGLGEWIALDALLAHARTEAQGLSARFAPEQPHLLDWGPTTHVQWSGAARELQSAISNVVSNAVRYTPAGGRVAVEWVERPDGRGELRVTDSGPGIAPEHLPRLTERFYRIDRSRSRESGGTGLGLAIVKHVLQRHGAELRIESVLGRGSCFSFIWPASRWRLDRAGAAGRHATEAPAGAHSAT